MHALSQRVRKDARLSACAPPVQDRMHECWSSEIFCSLHRLLLGLTFVCQCWYLCSALLGSLAPRSHSRLSTRAYPLSRTRVHARAQGPWCSWSADVKFKLSDADPLLPPVNGEGKREELKGESQKGKGKGGAGAGVGAQKKAEDGAKSGSDAEAAPSVDGKKKGKTPQQPQHEAQQVC